ncbi:MAG: energy transducer TonB [Bacteroidetes bacterium]|nr:MAG: energy transducer TonB [Bacteroidota bacterium]
MSPNPKHPKQKKFLNLPRISGGKEELVKFIRENLQYPEEALEAKVQGDVIIKYKITDNGEVFNPEIVKGIGHGCDEEAMRLVMLLKYDAVKNRGARVTASNKLKIPFRLQEKKASRKINMVYTPAQKEEPAGGKEGKTPETPKPKTYSYTIKINP